MRIVFSGINWLFAVKPIVTPFGKNSVYTYLYIYMRSASTTTSLYEFFVHKNSDAVEMYEENSGTVVLVKQISIKAVYFYTRLKNCFEIRMKEIGL